MIGVHKTVFFVQISNGKKKFKLFQKYNVIELLTSMRSDSSELCNLDICTKKNGFVDAYHHFYSFEWLGFFFYYEKM